MRRLLILLVSVVAVSAAEAQPRPPGGMANRYGPPPPQRGWFFFDLFAPRRPPPPPMDLQERPPSSRKSSSAPSTGRSGPGGAAGAAAARPPGSGEEAKPAMPASVPPPYEGDLMRIAEIMGALHYLRPLCGAPEGQRWRNEMQALIDAEAPAEDRKEKLTRGFNNGYVAFERSYRTCTPAANLAVQRYLAEGSKLAHEIVARYGN